jgi:3-oxoacyl-[acyl-carrier protein] reductase
VADLTDPAAARALAVEVERAHGPIGVLVNNAGLAQTGVAGRFPRFLEMDEADWRRDLALNLDTAFQLTRAIVPGMAAAGWGRVIMVSSVTGPLVSAPGTAGYGAAKAAMDGLMRGLALELGRSGVTVNSVAPGWIATGSSSPEELEAAARRAGRTAGRGGAAGRLPGQRRGQLCDRPELRGGRRQHHPGAAWDRPVRRRRRLIGLPRSSHKP